MGPDPADSTGYSCSTDLHGHHQKQSAAVCRGGTTETPYFLSMYPLPRNRARLWRENKTGLRPLPPNSASSLSGERRGGVFHFIRRPPAGCFGRLFTIA